MGPMQYVEAPNTGGIFSPALFLAGGITNCPDWQSPVVAALCDEKVTILNPRRSDFPIHDPTAAKAQIEWENRMLRRADIILFWFPSETLCPIVLYELGAWSMSDKPLVVGVDPLYQRRQDVEIQTALVRPDVKVRYSPNDLVKDVRRFLAAIST